jgi:hypothetical protein
MAAWCFDTSHAAYDTLDHLVWSPKYQRDSLQGAVQQRGWELVPIWRSSMTSPLTSASQTLKSFVMKHTAACDRLLIQSLERLSEPWAYNLLELPQRREMLVREHQSAAAGFNNDMRGA